MIEFSKARTDTKVTIAAERLALIAVLTLPITALSSVDGMHIIVNDRTDFPHLGVVGGGDAGDLGRPAALGQATGMVVAGPPGWQSTRFRSGALSLPVLCSQSDRS